MPFGNRIFYNGKDNDAIDEWIWLGEGVAWLSVLVMVCYLWIRQKEAMGSVREKVEGITSVVIVVLGGLLGAFFGGVEGSGIITTVLLGLLGGVLGVLGGLIIGYIGGILVGYALGLGVGLVRAVIGIEEAPGRLSTNARRVMYWSFAAAYLFNILDAAIFDIDREYIASQANLDIAPIYDIANQGAGVGLGF